MTRPKVNWLTSFLVLVVLVIVGAMIYQAVSYQTPKPPVVQVHVTQAPVSFPAGPVNSHPDTLPVQDRVPRWTRIDTPAGYPLVMRACLGEDGVYVDQNGSMSVVPSDPECKTADPPAK
jgi:hypothetical protein